MWKRDYKEYTRLAFEIYWFKKVCEFCKIEKDICVHHLDENPLNNEIMNL